MGGWPTILGSAASAASCRACRVARSCSTSAPTLGSDASLALAAGARVHAFEPSAASLEQLRAAVAAKACVHAYGLGDMEEERELLSTSNADGMASVYARQRPGLVWDWSETVRIRRLDDVCAEEAIERIDLLKLDVEGHELAVLEGASRMLAEDRVRMVQFEFGGTALDARVYLRDFFRLLEPRFCLFRILRDGLAPIEYDERWEIFTTANYLAVHG